MSKQTKPSNRVHAKNSNRETHTSGRMRFFYVLILLLMIFSLFLRVSGARRNSTGPTSAGTAARVLVFHQDNGNSCEDLAITAIGNAVFSNCGNGTEKQYTLNSSERSQLQSWINRYSPVNYDQSDPVQKDGQATQLYLNGEGKQRADTAETQQILDFATALAAKIVSEP